MNTDKTTISKKRIVPMKVRKEVSYTTEATIWISSELYNDYLIELANRNNLDGNNEIRDFIENETKYGVYNNRYAVHIRSTTISSDRLQSIIENDNVNLHKYGDWYNELSPKLHVKSRLFNRYI